MPTRYDHPTLSDLDSRVHTNTDILGDQPQQQARKLLLPQIAKKQTNALNVIPTPFEFFQRLVTGRRCSCFSVEDDPNGLCTVCFGTGVVGGYQKRGTKVWVLDVTLPEVSAVNVAPDWSRPMRPIRWILLPTAVFGYLETKIRLSSNVGQLDLLWKKATDKPKSKVEFWIKSPADLEWVEMTEDNMRDRLGFPEVSLRVVFRRDTPDDPLPALSCLRLSYKLIPHTTIKANVPQAKESLTLEEFGIYESFASQQLVLDSTIKSCSTEDFLYNVRDGLSWKVIEIGRFDPLGVLLEWALTCRLVQAFEPYAHVPIGQVLSPSELPPKALYSMYSVERIEGEALKVTTRAGMHEPYQVDPLERRPKVSTEMIEDETQRKVIINGGQ